MTTSFDSDFTIGVEEELLIVDPVTGHLRPAALSTVSAVGDNDAVDVELYASQVEVRSGRCPTADTVLVELAARRQSVSAAGVTVIGSGLHPTAPFGATSLVSLPRYRTVADTFAGLVDRAVESALHVHIGMPDAATAVRVLNGLRELLPIFIGLGANSPWWFGRDSKMASARYCVVREYPTRRVPDAFSSYDEYSQTVDRICREAGLADGTFVYWDVRINPKFGTVELREMDSQASPEASAGLAAFIQAIAVAIADGTVKPAPTSQDVLTWACFRAARDGLRAATSLADNGPALGTGHTLADKAKRLLAQVRPISAALGSADALSAVEQILRDGNGAARQRAHATRDGARGLLDFLLAVSNPAGHAAFDEDRQ